MGDGKIMTKEEAIDIIKCLAWHTRPNEEENVEQAIKALEQELFMNKPCVAHQICHEDKVKVLDKIRAEIEKARAFQRAMDEYEIATGLRIALEIIDKYKAESENPDANK